MNHHEDSRRKLESYPEAKIITAKKDCTIGKHFHKIKTEKFILSSGHCVIRVGLLVEKMKIGRIYTVLPDQYHEFTIKANSVLIGLNSHEYDKSDDYTL